MRQCFGFREGLRTKRTKNNKSLFKEAAGPSMGACCLIVFYKSRILQPLFEFIQRNDLLIAVLLPCLGGLVPSVELLLRDFPSLDPGETALVLPAVFLKYLVALAALCPLPDRGGAPAELPGRAGAAAILRRDPSGDGEIPPAVPAPPDRDFSPDTFPEREVYQVPDRVRV